MSGKYVNPFTDFGFKKLFGTEANKELLIEFLNTLLPEVHQIQDLSYRKTEQLGTSKYDRKAVYDLYCESPSGERFIVEVQRAKQKYFIDRSLFYATFPIQEQAQVGEWDFKLAPVYTIALLDFEFAEDNFIPNTEYRREFYLMDTVTHERLTNNLVFIYVELPKFKKGIDELKTLQDRWLYVFKNLPSFEGRPEKLKDRIFERFFELAAIAKFTPEEKAEYKESLKIYWDLLNVTNTAKEIGYKDGLEEGKEIGIQEGKELGIQEGKELGIQEGKELGIQEGKELGMQEGKELGIQEGKKEIAKNLLSMDMSIGEISRMTGLTEVEIMELSSKKR